MIESQIENVKKLQSNSNIEEIKIIKNKIQRINQQEQPEDSGCACSNLIEARNDFF